MADSRRSSIINTFVTGFPIKHSRSPIIHSYWMNKFGIAGSYKAMEVFPKDFSHFIAVLKEGRPGAAVGGNVTIPHKESAYRLADSPDVLAEELGAANTLWVEEGKLRATNTDGYGFVTNLDERHPGWDKTDRAVVFGAGGASRAVVQSLRDRGIAEIHVLNRTVERARELADRFGPRVFPHPQAALHEVMHNAGLFVNTTSLSMDGTESPQLDFSPLTTNAVVTDIVYVPLKTPILKMAEAQGIATIDGLGMLLHQAKPGFKRWFSKTPEVDETLRSLIIEDMEKH